MGGEQGRIQPGQPGQGLGVSAVALARIVVDHPELASIGHQNFVPQLLEQLAGPAGMCADLHGDPCPRQARELTLEGGHRSRDACFFQQPTSLVQHDHVRAPISQIQTDEKHAILEHGRFLLGTSECRCPCAHPTRMKHARGAGPRIPISLEHSLEPSAGPFDCAAAPRSLA